MQTQGDQSNEGCTKPGQDLQVRCRADLANFSPKWRIRHLPPFRMRIRHKECEATTGVTSGDRRQSLSECLQ
jgi:hypothetical protein